MDQRLADKRHTLAHLLAAAVMKLYPDAKRTIGPAIDDGFYFDFEFSSPISEKDFPKIEKEMRKLLPSWKSMERHELSPADAKKEYPDNPYKHELIDEFSGEGQTLSFYKSGEYWDLCKGGHVENPAKEIAPDSFKIDRLAGAYWRGDEKNTQLTRIYGLAFDTKEELDAYLMMREEAKKRDHRKIGQDQKLFFIDDIVGKGLVMWQPKGTIIRDEIEKLARETEEADGYSRVVTPHLAKQELFLKSGHLPYYEKDMYPGMSMDDGTYYLKAMNCPHHHVIYLHDKHSYRELPLRLAEYGTVYRNELSGTLAGLLRVRALAMNDAHIYCRKDQIKQEFRKALELTMMYFKIFGLNDYWFRLSKWNPERKDKYIDEPENWNYSESAIREVLDEMQVKYVEAEDEAAFYGPKVDIQFKSVIGRTESMSTVQLDFAAKTRFGLSYVDSDGKENGEVFVIHRAPLSTHERFMAFLIEHYAGVWPLWLSPVQVKVLPVSEKHFEYGRSVLKQLKESGIRAELDDANESLGKKIRNAKTEKVPYLFVVGDKEMESKTVTVENRKESEGAQPLTDIIQRLREEVRERK